MSKKLHTFDEWSKAGYKIIKGSKSVGRNKDGKCLFNHNQVCTITSSNLGDKFDGEEFDWENDPFKDPTLFN